ncbi:SelT/SelW/SelH family protein [Aspergillus homomorphus CBS 101889]|uniref:Selenoprotein domain protein n=1 Tax=Aspergillus homomorphus (strain CBS 101889) TaxID=1450537 RepID=A0A395HLS9_ASPHC|nr:hypothetical protein BO97DRAFT_398727 [Aspergillus homomorphus CBS 101889]RAL08185.1 hypothetical protein BO97DRAFT_398727 [Aspergillus homomorphus CBS 101889]
MISIPQTATPNASTQAQPQDQLTTAANPNPNPELSPSPSPSPSPSQSQDNSHSLGIQYPRITIKFCTQCKWMLRAAYFAQELLSTFSTNLGEVSLLPATGGIFTVTIYHQSNHEGGAVPPGVQTDTPESKGNGERATITETVLWDRKRDGGFPEVKVLKSLVRNVVDPGRDLGHTDRALKKKKEQEGDGDKQGPTTEAEGKGKDQCEDCQ